LAFRTGERIGFMRKERLDAGVTEGVATVDEDAGEMESGVEV
jgi:hypothetical protein